MHSVKTRKTAERVLSLPPLRMALELARLESEGRRERHLPRNLFPKRLHRLLRSAGKSAPVEPSEFASTADYIAWKKRNKG
jgi:hypothetical protein